MQTKGKTISTTSVTSTRTCFPATKFLKTSLKIYTPVFSKEAVRMTSQASVQ